MQGENMKFIEGAGASVAQGAGSEEKFGINGRYDVVCLGPDGQVKWVDVIDNLVVTVGKNDLLDKYLQNAWTPAWYMGLVDNTSFSTYAAGDTLASHAGWLEIVTGYSWSGSTTNRATMGWNSASAGAKASTTTVFNITATLTVLGALLTTTQARGTASNGGAGILLSAGTFQGGSRAVQNNDTLNVTYTLSLT